MSKSILQRALLAAAWAGGATRLLFPGDPGLPGAQGADVADLILALGALGLTIQPEDSPAWVLEAPGFARLGSVTVALGESGTAARLCSAALAFGGVPGSTRTLAVSGSLLGRRSPALLESLRTAGCAVRSPGPGAWPCTLSSVPLPPELLLKNPTSSQEVSALLFALAFEGGQGLVVQGEIPSEPYVHMTLALLESFGVRFEVQVAASTRYERIPSPVRVPREIAVEADASSAAVAWAAGLLVRRPVCVPGLPRTSIQGDAGMLQILERAGARMRFEADLGWRVQGALAKGWQVDLADTPDLAPPLVALAAALALGHFGEPQSSRFTGLGTLQGKESPRLDVLCAGLRRVGLPATSGSDWLEIPVGRVASGPLVLDPAGDHRMAFAFGLLALAVPSIQVTGPACVAKSWPGFWGAMDSLRAAPGVQPAPK